MAQPVVLQDTFTRMITDVPRDELPKDAVWLMLDYVPNLGANISQAFDVTNDPIALDQALGSSGRLTKRGGWNYVSEDVSIDSTSAASITAMGLLEPQNRLCLTTDNNKFGYITLPTTGQMDYTQVSTSSIQSKQPYFQFGDKLIILNSDGTTAPKSYDGTTFGNLAGSPPTGQYGAPWGDVLIIGNTSANPRRLSFSELGGASWHAEGYVDMRQIIRGIAVLPNAILVFGTEVTSRIRGKVPPPNSPDMVVDDVLFNVGCPFPSSIAVNGPNCVFANEEGVYLSNGTSLVQDVTKLAGVKSIWQAYAARSARPGGTAGGLDALYGGFIGNYYLVCQRATSNDDFAFLFDLTTMSCSMHTNFLVNAICMTPQIGDELYFTVGTRVTNTSPIFRPGAINKADADGTIIQPAMETRYFLDTTSSKNRWRHVYLDYLLVDAESDNPTLNITFVTDPYDAAYVETPQINSLDTKSLPETTITERAKLPVREASRGIAFRITQSEPSAETVLTAILADVYAREGGRIG